MAGAGSNIWYYWMPDQGGVGAWWRSKLTGTETDGGPKHYLKETGPFTPPPWGGELEPVNTLTTNATDLDPWQNPSGTPIATAAYFSHFTPDRWGRYIIFSNSFNTVGTAIWDATNDVMTVSGFNVSGGYSQWASEHHDWHAWSDWSASSVQVDSNGTAQSIGTQNFNSTGSQALLCSAHVDAGGDYDRLPRPNQSPDGTKITWHSTFLSGQTAIPNSYSSEPVNLLYVVAYYPYPPEIYQVSASNGTVTLTFDHGENSGHPRGYTTRKWPDESTGTYPPPRETKLLRLWQSANGTDGWTPVGTVNYNVWSNYNFSTGVWTGDTYQTISTTQAASTTMYYALTAQEWSGLESRTLSNVWQVVLDSNGNLLSQSQQSAYPSTPGGVAPFYTQAPPAPSNLQVTKQPVAGQYLLTWAEPVNTVIRYYNIYYSNTAAPAVTQSCRIASVPVGTSSYLDWLADPNASSGYYVITSVDTQGNEGTVAGDVTIPLPPARLRLLQ
jgi:hypothetical protein